MSLSRYGHRYKNIDLHHIQDTYNIFEGTDLPDTPYYEESYSDQEKMVFTTLSGIEFEQEEKDGPYYGVGYVNRHKDDKHSNQRPQII